RWMTTPLALLLAAGLLAAADKAAEKLPWQRELKGEEAKKATALEQQIGKLQAAGKSAEAVPFAEEIVQLRTRVQGSDHWQTADARWQLQALRQVAAQPAES